MLIETTLSFGKTILQTQPLGHWFIRLRLLIDQTFGRFAIAAFLASINRSNHFKDCQPLLIRNSLF